MDKLIIALLGLIISTFIGGIESTCFAQIEGEKQVQLNEILIAPNCISVPLEIILLVRKDGSCGAIKFTKVYTGKTDQDLYADYVSYYQGDGTGEFTKKNVVFKKGQLYSPRLRGFGRFGFSFGNREYIECGRLKLQWAGKGIVCFYHFDQREGDYGIELVPTKWTDISQINVFDNRLKWFRHDPKRKDMTIPKDKLW